MSEQERAPERRTYSMMENDILHGTPQHLIEEYNRGWKYHEDSFVMTKDMTPSQMLLAMLQDITYQLEDRSPEANAWWKGFEDAQQSLEQRLFGHTKSNWRFSE